MAVLLSSPFRTCGALSLREGGKRARGRGNKHVALVAPALLSLVIPAQSQTLPDQRQRLAAAKRDAAVATRKAEVLAARAAAERNAADKARAEEAAQGAGPQQQMQQAAFETDMREKAANTAAKESTAALNTQKAEGQQQRRSRHAEARECPRSAGGPIAFSPARSAVHHPILREHGRGRRPIRAAR